MNNKACKLMSHLMRVRCPWWRGYFVVLNLVRMFFEVQENCIAMRCRILLNNQRNA